MNNKVCISGKISEEPVYSHTVAEKIKFYRFYLTVNRLSGSPDILPVIISEDIFPINKIKKGINVSLFGTFRSRNVGTKVDLFVFCDSLLELQEEQKENENNIELIGTLCKPPFYRKTPFGKEATDLLIAVNRRYGKSDYIPCIAWGKNARYSAALKVGEKVSLSGRVQSRLYEKKINDNVEIKIAYEMSINDIRLIEGGK